MTLILSNFAATMLADVARGQSTDVRLVGSLLIGLLLIAVMRMISEMKSGPGLDSLRVASGWVWIQPKGFAPST